MLTKITEYEGNDISNLEIYQIDEETFKFTTKCKVCGKEVTETCDSIMGALELIECGIYCNEHYVKNMYWNSEFRDAIDEVTAS